MTVIASTARAMGMATGASATGRMNAPSRDLARRRPERERDATRGGARTRRGRARGAIETIGEFADRAQAVTANAHAALVTSKVFERDAAATTGGIDGTTRKR